MFNDKDTITVRLTADDKELIDEFAQIADLEDTISPRLFFIATLEAALSKKKPVEVSKKEDKEQIEKLSSLLKDKDVETSKLIAEIQELNAVIEELKEAQNSSNDEISELQKQNGDLQLKHGEFILKLSDIQIEYLAKCLQNQKIRKYFNDLQNSKLKSLFQIFDGNNQTDIPALLVNILFYTALMEKDPLKFCKWDDFLTQKRKERKENGK